MILGLRVRFRIVENDSWMLRVWGFGFTLQGFRGLWVWSLSNLASLNYHDCDVAPAHHLLLASVRSALYCQWEQFPKP